MSKVWINGKLVDADKAMLPVSDRGFLYGDGVFETMRSYAGVVFKIDEHISRLSGSLKAARIKSHCTRQYIRKEIYRTLDANRLKSAYIRLTITRGEGRFGLEYKDTFTPNIVIVAKEFGEYPDRMYAGGISAGVVSIRQNETTPLSGIKSLNFMNYILARFEARDKGFDEAILVNSKGHVAEAATSNIFMVKGNAIITPSLDSGILPGITRSVIIQIARRLKIFAKEMAVTYRELMNSDEIFLTNSLAEVLPVTKVDNKKIGDGEPGDITKLLRISYQKEVIREVLR